MPKKDIPYIKIVGGLLLLAGGYQIGKSIGLFKPKTKKSKCNKSSLSEWTLADGTSYKLDPAIFVAKLNDYYKGINWTTGGANSMLRLIAENMTVNDLNCIHNAWLKLIDAKESLYDFLDWQTPYPFTVEAELLPKAKQKLAAAGLKNK